MRIERSNLWRILPGLSTKCCPNRPLGKMPLSRLLATYCRRKRPLGLLLGKLSRLGCWIRNHQINREWFRKKHHLSVIFKKYILIISSKSIKIIRKIRISREMFQTLDSSPRLSIFKIVKLIKHMSIVKIRKILRNRSSEWNLHITQIFKSRWVKTI